MPDGSWKRLAAAQCGMLTRAQLAGLGVTRSAVRHQLLRERWIQHTPTVIGTTTGPVTRDQLMWLGVLHAGGGSLIGGLTAAEDAGLRNWHRDHVTVLIDADADVGDGVDGVHFVRTRRSLSDLRRTDRALPVARLEPAILLFAAYGQPARTAEGVLAASVQQRLTTPDRLREWIDALSPLRWASRFRSSLSDIEGGAHSVSEIDVRRMCRRFGLALPRRQVRRRDASGRLRFTDCEWRLEDGRTLVLEVDGGFHMEVEHWEDDLARQRALTAPDRLVVRCSGRELRDCPGDVARDLLVLGVPRAA